MWKNPGKGLCDEPCLQYLVASLKRSSTVSGWFLRPLGCSSSWKVGIQRAWGGKRDRIKMAGKGARINEANSRKFQRV